MKISNRKYADKLMESLKENKISLTVKDNGVLVADREVAYLLAKATGLRSKKTRLVKKRFKQVIITLLYEMADEVATREAQNTNEKAP